MIPKKSTPIKNEILIDIFAKGLLSKDEMRIISYIIRWSWGFNGKHRRQDFTKELTKRQIAGDINMDEGHLNRNLKKMVAEKKITDQEGCYQFNEHYQEWKNLTNSQTKKQTKLAEKSNKTCRLVKQNLTNSQVKLDEKSSSTPLKPIFDKPLLNPKETKRNYKETLKKSDIFIKVWNKFKTMRNKIKKPMTKYAEELIMIKLNKLTNNEEEQIAILNESIMNNWQGVFPLKKQSTAPAKKVMTEEEILKIIGGKDE